MTNEEDTSKDDIAIIGMAGRFPGADNIDTFWKNLRDGVESIRFLSDEELLAAGVSRRDLANPNYVRACPVLDDIDKFDAAFFGFSPREASVMDPTHRFFLEVVWEALEHSGNTGLHDEGTVAVFAGAGGPFYLMNNVRLNSRVMGEVGEFLARHTGNDMNFLATRASYEMDLRGPSMNIQTACSSALTAVHQARVSLLSGECDVALAGGSTINIPAAQGYVYSEGEILSPDGHCRPFDHRSAGTVFGSGTGCLVLKRLSDALDNGDTIHAVVKGSAINNDGALKVGYLAPGVEKQVDVIKDALKAARVSGESISYVETHGTGTSVGDPIELTALSEALASETQKKQFCGVGSVKSNIGHLGEAAATASLIKVILAMKNRQLPATLGFEKPNPQLELEDSPLFVVDRLTDWKSEGPLRCGITALGAGGTNCHVILEEGPPALPGEGERDVQLLLLSAKSRAALDRQCVRLAEALDNDDSLDLADVAYTLSVGRRPLELRRVLTASDKKEAVEKLRSSDPKKLHTTVANTSDPGLVFTFPGGGAQYASMGADLYEAEDVYREAVDECLSTVDQILDVDLRTLLFASPDERSEATKKLERPSLSLPALFTTEYALARLFESWGLHATAMVGHSMGEYVAACLAGVFTVEEGIRLVAMRGRLFEQTERGKMVALSMPEKWAREKMPEGLSIAAVNAPELCVASGPCGLVEQFKRELTEADVNWTPIHIDVAAHSSMLDSILDEFREFCRGIQFNPPNRPMTSNLTGGWLSAQEATDPEYWVQHLRNTVRFSDCVEAVLKNGPHVFLELGPGRTLTTLVGAQNTQVLNAVNSIRHYKEEANDLSYALMTAGKVWAAGAQLDFTALYEEQLRNRIPLPTYPFDKSSYWVEPLETGISRSSELQKRDDISEWFYTPSWVPTPVVPTADGSRSWLIVCDDKETAGVFSRALIARGATSVVSAIRGKALRRVGSHEWRVDPEKPSHFREILEALDSESMLPEHTAYLLGLTLSTSSVRAGLKGRWLKETRERLLEAGVGSFGSSAPQAAEADYLGLVHLAKALAAVCETGQLSVATSQAFRISDEEILPQRRLLVGPTLVVPKEVPELKTRFIDARGDSETDCVEAVVAELWAQSDDQIAVLRGARRWTRAYPHIKLPTKLGGLSSEDLKENAVVVIAGGLGGIGLAVAKHLAQQRPMRFALLSRRALPPRLDWEAIAGDEKASLKLRLLLAQLTQLEQAGSQVMPVVMDITDFSSVQSGAQEIRDHFGEINVLIHGAGVLDDGPFQTKSDESIRRVLAPKVQGTIHLDRAMGQKLDLFVIFSSVASILGLPGQIDYAAGNAFLDAFAEERSTRTSGRTVVVGWNAWRDVGMLANQAGAREVIGLPASPCAHPQLGGQEKTSDSYRFGIDFDSEQDWLLREHKIEGGSALIAGTGFVELVRAAFCENAKGGFVELTDVTFLAPFQVATDKSRRMEIELRESGGVTEALVRSLPERTEHMSARLRTREGAHLSDLDLEEIRSRCTVPSRLKQGGFLEQEFVAFGPRWGNIQSIVSGEGEALLDLRLPDPFATDLPDFAYHPAMMDMATGGGQHLLPGFDAEMDFYVPFAYQRITIYAPITAHCFSHIRLDPKSQGEIALFDITISDPLGKCLIDIQGFTMKRAHKDAAIAKVVASSPSAVGNQVMDELLREAICPEEGVVALDRVLGQSQVSQVIASSLDINQWLDQLRSDASRLTVGEEEGEEAGFSRPELGSDYVAPENTIEEGLVAIWSKLLGVEAPGVVDDFFELGGDSLTAVRFFARVKKKMGVSLPISTLFQAPTIRALALLLQQQGVEITGGERVKDPGRKRFEPFRSLAPVDNSPGFKALGPGVYTSKWEQTDSLPSAIKYEGGRCWLLFLDDAGLGQSLRKRLVDFGDTVILVRHGDGYSKNSSTDYTLAPEQGRSSYDSLVRDLVASGNFPTDIIHMWLVTADESFRAGSSYFHRTQEHGFYSLLSLAQAIADAEVDASLEIVCVTNSLYAVVEGDAVYDSKATVLGPVESFHAELPRTKMRHIDLKLPSRPRETSLGQQLVGVLRDTDNEKRALETMGDHLLSEVLAPWSNETVALSSSRRFRRYKAPLELARHFKVASAGAVTYLLLGIPTLAMLSMVEALSQDAQARFLWVQNAPGAPVASLQGESLVEERLRQGRFNLREVQADLSNREHILRVLREEEKSALRLGGAIVGAETPPRELMQLAEPGMVEEHLAHQIQRAQILTSALAASHAEAFVVLLGRAASTTCADGEVAQRAGVAFLASHAEHRLQSGQRVLALFESGKDDLSQLDLKGGDQWLNAASDFVMKLAGGETLSPAYWLIADDEPAERMSLPSFDESVSRTLREEQPKEAELELLELWETASGRSKVKLDTSLTALGMSLLDGARLMTHLRNRYALTQGVHSLMHLQTVAEFAKVLHARTVGESVEEGEFRHLVPMHPSHPGAGTPFFLVAGMFGNILNLRHLGRLLGADRQVYGVQAKGLYGAEKPHSTIEEMAEAYLKEIRSKQPHGPYLLGGFSGGGLTAYEMAKCLRREGEDVASVVMLDTPLPQEEAITVQDRLMVQKLRFRRQGLKYVGRWARDRASWELKQLRHRFVEIDETYNPGEFKNDAIQDAFVRAAAAYDVGSYAGHLTLFRPALDKTYEVSPGRYLTEGRELVHEDQGWSPFVSHMNVFEVPGDHDHMVLEPEVRVLAELLRTHLVEAERGSSSDQGVVSS